MNLVLTGSTSGIGWETLLALLPQFDRVFLPVRNLAKAEKLMDFGGDTGRQGSHNPLQRWGASRPTFCKGFWDPFRRTKNAQLQVWVGQVGQGLGGGLGQSFV